VKRWAACPHRVEANEAEEAGTARREDAIRPNWRTASGLSANREKARKKVQKSAGQGS